MISEQGGVKSRPEPIVRRVDHLFPYYMTCACVRTDPPPRIFYLAGCLFNPSSVRCLISIQNRCHMDLWSV
jgi:hypothetical protein